MSQPLTQSTTTTTEEQETPIDKPQDESSPEIPQPEEWEIQRDSLKHLADTAFRSSDYTCAITHYSEAITLDPTYHILYSNRSAAYLSNKDKSRALADAKKCVELNADFVKGYGRLSAALLSLGRFGEATGNWRECAKRKGGEELAKKGMDEVRKLEMEAGKRRRREEAEALRRRELFELGTPTPTPIPKKAETVKEKDDDDPLLDDFFNDVETAVTSQTSQAPPPEPEKTTKPTPVKSSDSLTEDLGTSESEISRILSPNHEWKNLNPFSVFQISHHSTLEQIQKRYKALSLLVHPDKNLNRRDDAKESFDYVRKSMDALQDEDKRRHVFQLVEQGFKIGKRDFSTQDGKETAKATMLLEMQQKAVMKLFADIEVRRLDVDQRKRNQEQRERKQEDEEENKLKKEREFDNKWKEGDRMSKRVGNWRDFQKKPPTKKGKVDP